MLGRLTNSTVSRVEKKKLLNEEKKVAKKKNVRHQVVFVNIHFFFQNINMHSTVLYCNAILHLHFTYSIYILFIYNKNKQSQSQSQIQNQSQSQQ
jgi:hypothetical protein